MYLIKTHHKLKDTKLRWHLLYGKKLYKSMNVMVSHLLNIKSNRIHKVYPIHLSLLLSTALLLEFNIINMMVLWSFYIQLPQ